MRLTVLTQYAKGLAHHDPGEAADLRDRLERIKWKLWHGDGREALARIEDLADDVDGLESDYPNLKRFATAANEFATYIRNPDKGFSGCGLETIAGLKIALGLERVDLVGGDGRDDVNESVDDGSMPGQIEG
jgi:hypothetical protein